MFGMCSKIDVASTAMNRRRNRLVLLDSAKKTTNTSIITNYTNVAYDLLPYNMAPTRQR